MIDYVNSVRYTIDHRNKTIKKYTLECAIGYYETLAKAKLEAPEKFAELDEEMKSFMGKGNILDIVMKSIIGEDDMPTVAKTGAEKILGRKCEKRKATFGGISIEESIDPTLIPPIIQNKDEFNSLLSYLSKVMLKFSDELRKPEGGTPLKFRIIIPVGPKILKVEQVATKVVQGPIPASVFELPKGYAMEDVGEKKLKKLKEALVGRTN